MYHDTININFRNSNWKDISFDYSFLISKNQKDKFSPINYGDLLGKFSNIGFNLKYIKFNDIDEGETVYCTYNYQPNFNIFFKAYTKLLQYKKFDISFEYGVIINGKFHPNNMNTFAGVWFKNTNSNLGSYNEEIIRGQKHKRKQEFYQIVDKDGNLIAVEIAEEENNFEQHFFERYDVKVALRKYKLSRLKLFSE